MVHDPELETKLLSGEYQTAFDPLSKRWVIIIKAYKKENDEIGILVARYSDEQLDVYKPFELCRYG